MRPFRILFISVLLLGAIACSDEDENIPAPASPVTTSDSGSVHPILGFFNIVRFEQDGVENPELRGQFLDFYKDGRVQVHGRNYLYEGEWSFLQSKDYIRIDIPVNEIQAIAVSSPEWRMIAEGEDLTVLTLLSDAGGTVKKLELKPRRLYGARPN